MSVVCALFGRGVATNSEESTSADPGSPVHAGHTSGSVYRLTHSGDRSAISAITDMQTNFILQPWQMLLVMIASWMNREQQNAIEYLRTENSVLREKLGKKRILLNNDQRRRLVVKGNVLGRKRLKEVATLFTPDTILRWHRQLVAKKWDHTDRRKTIGRPRIRKVIVDCIVSFARENPTWGYLKKLLDSARILRFLSRSHPEILTEFQKLVEARNLQEAAEEAPGSS